MDFDKDDQVIRQFLEKLRERFGTHLKNIIFFGSRARGEGVFGSDYDFVIVLDEVSSKSKDTIDEVVGDILNQFNAVFSVFLISEKKFRSRSFDPFLTNVRKEGISLL